MANPHIGRRSPTASNPGEFGTVTFINTTESPSIPAQDPSRAVSSEAAAARAADRQWRLRRTIKTFAGSVFAATITYMVVKYGLGQLGGDNIPSSIDTSKPYKQYTVQPGEDLNGISGRAEPSKDSVGVAGEIATTIARRNHLTLAAATIVVPGEVIPLPEDSQIGNEAPLTTVDTLISTP